MGELIRLEPKSADRFRVKFAKVVIRVDITKMLTRCLAVPRGSGCTDHYLVWYEDFP